MKTVIVDILAIGGFIALGFDILAAFFHFMFKIND